MFPYFCYNFLKNTCNILVLYTYHSLYVAIFLCRSFETYFYLKDTKLYASVYILITLNPYRILLTICLITIMLWKIHNRIIKAS